MIRTVEKIDDLVPVKNVVIYATYLNGLEPLIQGLLKYCPDVHIYSSSNNYLDINKFMSLRSEPKQEGKYAAVLGNHFNLEQLVLKPEINGTLVESFQSKLFLGISAKAYCPQHQKIVKDTKTVLIDLVIINLAPILLPEGPNDFENVSTRIDIAGQAILSAVVANSPRVMAISNSSDYDALIEELERFKGSTCFDSRKKAANKCADYGLKYSLSVRAFMESVNVGEARECYEIQNTVSDFLASEKEKEKVIA